MLPCNNWLTGSWVVECNCFNAIHRHCLLFQGVTLQTCSLFGRSSLFRKGLFDTTWTTNPPVLMVQDTNLRQLDSREVGGTCGPLEIVVWLWFSSYLQVRDRQKFAKVICSAYFQTWTELFLKKSVLPRPTSIEAQYWSTLSAVKCEILSTGKANDQ